MKEKMIPAFEKAQGGLFDSIGKADTGDVFNQMQEQGVAMMSWADPFMPDKSLPKHIEKALVDSILADSSSHYTAPIGSLKLKEKIAEKLKKVNHLIVDPARNILITPGSDAGLYFAMLPFIHEGDEVLLPSPSYPNNFLNVEIMGGKSVIVELQKEKGYQFDKEDLEKHITSKTKMIVLTHPNNPTTTVFNRTSLEALREVVLKYDLILVCDQAFEDFCYENEMITPAAMPGMFEHTVTVMSFSKGMGLSGLRVGYIVCCDEIMDSLYGNAVSVIGATSTSSQNAMVAAFEDLSFMNVFEKSFDFRRHKAYEIFKDVKGIKMDLPESGFLAWIDVSELGDSTEITQYLIQEAKVAVNDGKFYGKGGEGHIRVVLGVFKDDDKIVEILYRMRDAFIKLGKSK